MLLIGHRDLLQVASDALLASLILQAILANSVLEPGDIASLGAIIFHALD